MAKGILLQREAEGKRLLVCPPISLQYLLRQAQIGYTFN